MTRMLGRLPAAAMAGEGSREDARRAGTSPAAARASQRKPFMDGIVSLRLLE
jgi:hypothetical protein